MVDLAHDRPYPIDDSAPFLFNLQVMIKKRFLFPNPNDRSPVLCVLVAVIFFFGVVFIGNQAVAEDNSDSKKFKDQAELSVVNTSGNTDVLTKTIFIHILIECKNV